MRQENSMKYFLMNKNYKTVELEGEIRFRKDIHFPRMIVTQAVILDEKRCPPGFLGTKNDLPQEIERWMDKRAISGKRSSLKRLPIIKWSNGYPHFLSMSDQYWIRKEDDFIPWEKVNFYDNQYSCIIGQVSASFNRMELKSLLLPQDSPDLCTNGLQDKMWKRIGKDNFLLKWTSEEDAQAILSEVLASEVLEKINLLPTVHYDLTIENYRLCTRCKNFVGAEEEFVPAWHVYRAYQNLHPESCKNGAEDVYKVLMQASEYFEIPDVEKYVDNMIISDRVIANFDRHLGNFGFMRNIETGEYTQPAPLFDFGNAFFPRKEETKKERYFFSERAKSLLCDKRLESAIGKMKDITTSSYLSIPNFYEFKDTAVQNIFFNMKELQMAIAEEKKDRQKKKNMDVSMAV